MRQVVQRYVLEGVKYFVSSYDEETDLYLRRRIMTRRIVTRGLSLLQEFP